MTIKINKCGDDKSIPKETHERIKLWTDTIMDIDQDTKWADVYSMFEDIYKEGKSTIINATDSADFDMVSHWGEIDGTSLQGYMDISFDEIEEILGKPNMEGDPYKVDAEWGIKFSDGTVATIYNYKTGRRYLGNEGLDVRDIRDWHIGGHNKSVVARVCKLLNTKEHIMNYEIKSLKKLEENE